MEKLALVAGNDLETLWSYLKGLSPDDPYPVYDVQFWVTDEGLKVKVNSGVWSIGLGVPMERP